MSNITKTLYLKSFLLFFSLVAPSFAQSINEYDPNPGGLCFSDTNVQQAWNNHYPASPGYTTPGKNISIMQTPLPPSNSGNYPAQHQYYPGNHFATVRHDLIDQRWNPSAPSAIPLQQSYLLWVNRCADINNSGTCANDTKFKGNYYFIDKSLSGLSGYQDVIGGVLKPNLPNAQGQLTRHEIRPQFTTVDKADGCTRINLGRAMGFPDSYLQNVSQIHGLVDQAPGGQVSYRYHEMSDIVQNWQSLISSPIDKNGVRYYFLEDRCIVPPKFNVNKVDGVMLDWEVHDHRSIAQSKRLFDRLRTATNQKSKELIFYTNSFANSSAAIANGLVTAGGNYSTLKHIYQNTDYFSPLVWSGATPGNPSRQIPGRDRLVVQNGATVAWNPVKDLENTLSNINTAMGWGSGSTKDYSKVLPFVSLYDTKLSEALTLRNRRKIKGLAGYGIWRNYVKQNGSCQKTVDASPGVVLTRPNQVIACLTMSRCNGQF